MSEQEVRGTLARGGTFRASPDSVDIFDQAGQLIASFEREVISGVSREGQVVTLERHNDSVVTITAASIAEADDLEQFVGSQLAAPSGARIYDTHEPAPEPEPPVPPYTPEEAQPQPEPELTHPAPPTPTPSIAEQQVPGGPGYDAMPSRTGRGNRWLLWGCLGCGGLLVLALIFVGLFFAFWTATDLESDDSSDSAPVLPTFVVEPTPTPGGDAAATPPETGAVEPPADGEILQPGQTAQVEGLEVTLVESRIDDAPIFEPEAGNEYLILRFQITNTNDEEYLVSTILQFALRDEAGNSYPQTFYAGSGEQLDGTLAAGAAIDGEIAFEAPQDGGPFIVHYVGIFGDEAAVWLVGPDN